MGCWFAELYLWMGCLLLTQFALKLQSVGRQIPENMIKSRMWATVFREKGKMRKEASFHWLCSGAVCKYKEY